MRYLFLFTLMFSYQNATALDVTYTLKAETKDPQVAQMTCSGQSCSCAPDTVLDVQQKRCLTCPAGHALVDAKGRKQCVDPSIQLTQTIKDWKAFDPAKSPAAQLLLSEESSQPTLCDVTKMVDGKFTSCECAVRNVKVTLNEAAKQAFTVQIFKTFSQQSQKCERSRPYVVTVPNISCRGPRQGAFKNLEALGLIAYDYESPDFSLGSCGAVDGTHTLNLKKSENTMSVLDAIAATIDLSSDRSIESFEIDADSLNY